MRANQFDRLAKRLAAPATRRGALRLLAGSLLGGLLSRRGASLARAAQIDDVWLTDTGPLYTCAAQGLTDCFGVCVDLSTDSANCGRCDFNCYYEMCEPGTVCEGGFACIGGFCQSLAVDDTGVIHDVGLTDTGTLYTCAPQGLTDCGGVCVDLASDEFNCGACFTACGGLPCLGGVCSASAVVETEIDDGLSLSVTCAAQGLVDCYGVCVDLATDYLNCGGCDTLCVPPDTCQNGQCLCQSGFTRCVLQEFAPCSDLASDKNHCGACFNYCAPGEFCQGGQCRS